MMIIIDTDEWWYCMAKTTYDNEWW